MSGALHQKFNPWFYDAAHAAAGRYVAGSHVHCEGQIYYLNPDLSGAVGDPNVSPNELTDDWLIVTDFKFDEISTDAGITAWTTAQMGKSGKWSLSAHTSAGEQTHELSDEWLTPGREITVNRNGDSDVVVRVGDGTVRPIFRSINDTVGELEGARLQFPGETVFKVHSDNRFIVERRSLQSATITSTESTTPTVRNTAPVAIGGSVNVPQNVDSFVITLTNFDRNDDITGYSYGQPVNGSVVGTPPTLIYTPNQDFIGIDEIVFTITDSDGDNDTATITINVIPDAGVIRRSVFPDANTVDKVIIENHASPKIADDEYISLGTAPNRFWERN